ncbi:hypothetical protein QM012_003240 [Aureobasidium pullulans]|uniref:Rad21/Rec8-like protein N-terminal domain-containing protein n=1 Tax=Aureobasidium pullulans TaxID=5580 RepID=A0ABR0T9N9_AURPU
MFYSHEVLTSRKHGVATVWLVATLGSKSTLKKVDRKDICAVNIPKACQTIVSPEAPMALRLQSNLLYGVTRVYGEQCNFVLKDAQSEQNKIRTLLRSLHATPIELDDKHKAKPGQLVLDDDPNFIPELAWGIDFDPFHDILGFTNGEGSSQRSSLLSPHTAVSSGLGSEHMDPKLGLIITHMSSVGGDDFGLGLGGASVGGSDHNRGYSRSLFGANEEGLLPELDLGLGLDFDVDGNIIDNATVPESGRAASVHTPAPVIRDGVLPALNADRDVVMYDDDSLPVYQDDVDMQDVEPFAPRTATQQVDPDDQATAQGEEAQSQTSSTTASAPAARVRIPQPLPWDQELELHTSDLQHWDREYLENQLTATQHKLHNKSLVLARKNANFWVLQNGIGGLGAAYQGAEDCMPELLKMFSGNALLEALTGIQLTIAGTKHPRDVDESDEDQERRVRSRSNDDEVSRAAESNDTAVFDTGFVDDIIHDSIEHGREAPTPLADHHSSAHALPWNHAAPPSRGSSHTGFVPPFPPLGPGNGVPSSSIAGGGGFNVASSHRGRRTVSASPLVGRGALPTTNVEDMNFMQSDDNAPFNDAYVVSDTAAENLPRPSQATEFDLFGPAAAISTQVAGTSQFLSAAVSTESLNFLAFVKAGIAEVQERQETTIEAIASVLDVEASEAKDEYVEFEDLLKPESNSRVVAAQGFLHVLTLVTRGLLSADQEEAFGQIELRVL